MAPWLRLQDHLEDGLELHLGRDHGLTVGEGDGRGR